MQSFQIDGVGEVQIKKSARAKRLILSIQPNGSVRATIPKSVPYIIAKQYVLKNREWVKKHLLSQPKLVLRHGQMIGRDHVLKFRDADKLSSRVGKNEVLINIPRSSNITDSNVQEEALKASTRAIRRQAEAYLPSKLFELAQIHGYSFSQVRCKALKTRWGSCSSDDIINLNIWLMQLPEALIEYVLMHELTHLNHRHHQKQFWDELEQNLPNYKQLRKLLKLHKPYLSTQA